MDGTAKIKWGDKQYEDDDSMTIEFSFKCPFCHKTNYAEFNIPEEEFGTYIYDIVDFDCDECGRTVTLEGY